MTRERLRDTRALLAARRWSAAYYLAGYAVECALKSCIVTFLLRTDQFPDRRFSELCWTHNLDQLLGLAGLKVTFGADAVSDPDLSDNWASVREWNESTRYTRKTKNEALELYNAITDAKHGVLSWIKSHW